MEALRVPLEDDVVRNKISNAPTGARINIEWGLLPASNAPGNHGYTSYSSTGVVTRRNEVQSRGRTAGAPLTIDVEIDTTFGLAGPGPAPRPMRLPPESTDYVIYKVDVLQARLFTLPPECVGLRELRAPPHCVIYSDGGTVVTSGESAAAFVVRFRDGVSELWSNERDCQQKQLHERDEEHGRYYAHSTNNCMEFIAATAALKWAAAHPPAPGSENVLVVDSELVFNAIKSGVKNDSAPHLRPLRAALLDAYMPVASTVVLMRMLRKYGNPADVTVGRVRREAAARGEAALFGDSPIVTTKNAQTLNIIHQQQLQATVDPQTTTLANRVRGVEDFAKLYRYRALTACPIPSRVEWAVIVEQHCKAIVDNPHTRTMEQLSDAMIALIMLPVLYLPASAPRQRVCAHLRDGKPFNVNVDEVRADQREDAAPARQEPAAAATSAAPRGGLRSELAAGTNTIDNNINNEDTSGDNERVAAISGDEEAKKRIARAVERLAMDRRIKQAMKLVFAAADRNDMPFEKKVELLRTKKFIKRSEAFETAQLPYTRAFSSATVNAVLKKMPRQAAPCIDRWTPEMLLQAIEIRPEIASLLGQILAKINDDVLGPRVGDIIRAGRAVGIPKDQDGIRPIVLSCFFAKLVGGCVFEECKPTNTAAQFARPDCKNGCEKIIHKVRAEYQQGKAILRFDISNAFGTATRARIAKVLAELDSCAPGKLAAVRRYFYTMYGPTSKLVVFAPGGRDAEFIDFEEGVRQGDSFSAYFFCLLMDQVMRDISAQEPAAVVRGYMDDLTITTDKESAHRVASVAVQVLAQWGFTANITKSKILCMAAPPNAPTHVAADTAAPRFDVRDDSRSFVVLGGNITNSYAEYNANQSARNARFFDCVKNVPMHPQIAFTIARLCGGPRMKFYASVTPPQHSRDTVATFQHQLIDYIQSPQVLNFVVPGDVLHERFGTGIPDYINGAERLYVASMNNATHTGVLMPQVELVYNNAAVAAASTARLESQQNAQWMCYVPSTSDCHMAVLEFQIAMAIRCGTLPTHILHRMTSTSCNCNNRFTWSSSDGHAALIDHVLRCPSAAEYHAANRHTSLKSAVASVLREFGWSVQNEPNYYDYSPPLPASSQPPAGAETLRHAHQRPDLTVLAGKCIATDFVVSCQQGKLGAHAAAAAEIKKRTHTSAVERMQHTFIPFAVETHGHLDKSATQFINEVMSALPSYVQFHFRIRMLHAVSTALAKARVKSILTMVFIQPRVFG